MLIIIKNNDNNNSGCGGGTIPGARRSLRTVVVGYFDLARREDVCRVVFFTILRLARASSTAGHALRP